MAYQMKLKKGDKVVIISGKDKGHTGVITEVFPKTLQVSVEGANVRTVHRKADQKNQESAIEKVSKPIPMSKVMWIENTKSKDKKDIKASKLSFKYVTDSKTNVTKKVRVVKKTKIEI